MGLAWKEKIKKGAFEERLIEEFGSGLEKGSHKDLDSPIEGSETYTNVTLYYKDGRHIGSWSKGLGWVFEQEKKEQSPNKEDDPNPARLYAEWMEGNLGALGFSAKVESSLQTVALIVESGEDSRRFYYRTRYEDKVFAEVDERVKGFLNMTV